MEVYVVVSIALGVASAPCYREARSKRENGEYSWKPKRYWDQ